MDWLVVRGRERKPCSEEEEVHPESKDPEIGTSKAGLGMRPSERIVLGG